MFIQSDMWSMEWQLFTMHHYQSVLTISTKYMIVMEHCKLHAFSRCVDIHTITSDPSVNTYQMGYHRNHIDVNSE